MGLRSKLIANEATIGCCFGAVARAGVAHAPLRIVMIRKLSTGKYRLYSRKKNAKTGKRRNLGTFSTRKAAEQHERAVQFFKRR